MTKPRYIGTNDTSANNRTRLVSVSELKLNPANERVYDAASDDNVALRQSIRAAGLLKPLEVYEDGVVHDGNRRLFNLLWMWENEGYEVPPIRVFIVERESEDTKAVLLRLNTNEARQFSIVEQGIAFAKLREAGMNNSEIAAATPFTGMAVGNALMLHDASEPVRALVAEGKVSATLAVETMRTSGDDAEVVLKAAVEFAESQGKARATQRHVDHVTGALDPDDEVVVGPSVGAEADATPVVVPVPESGAAWSPSDVPWTPGDVGGEDAGEGVGADFGLTEGLDGGENHVEIGEISDASAEGSVDHVDVEGDEPPAVSDEQPAAGQTKHKGPTASDYKRMLEQFLPYAERVLSKRGKRDFKAETEAFMDTLDAMVQACREFGIGKASMDVE